MKEILCLTVFLLQEIETPKTFKIHGNNTSHNFNQTTILHLKMPSRSSLFKNNTQVVNLDGLVISTYQAIPKRPNI